ncbi:T9SS type A sorting domain-containing protein, partial [uncultured Psychroserpens sp.]|uniref:T9SS type A sorting domain-containing protein n=1 Tax=uncultured Psychroserpens sp. TaxID=255436 RepID=UPI00262DCDE4
GQDECGRPLSAGPYEFDVEQAPEADVTVPQFPLDIECVDAAGYEAADATYSNGLEETACEISGSITADVVKDYDQCGGTITISYSGQDECGRPLSAGPYTIEVKPAPAPVFDEILNASIPCEELDTYEPEFLGYSNGLQGPCGINGEVQGVADEFDGSCGTFDVNFSYVSCGVEITATQVITVIDETPPMFTGEAYPQGISNVNGCLSDAPAPLTEAEVAAMFMDNCGDVNVTLTIVSPEENTDCQWAVLYRYDIKDDCDNFAAPIKIFHNGGDKTAPELTGTIPSGVTGLQCLSENPGAPDASVIADQFDDNCSDVFVVALDPVITGDDCGWTATYEYTVKDACDNAYPNVVIVNSGADNTPPTLEGEIPLGENTLNLCFDAELGEPTEEEIAALFSDNCTETLDADNVVKTEHVTIGSDCEWIRVFEYVVTDDCGNPYPTFKVNYQGGDTEAPQQQDCFNEVMTISTENYPDAACPDDAVISLQIGDMISVADRDWTVANISVQDLGGTLYPCFTDNCASVEELTYRVIGKDVDKSACSTTLTVTFEVEDNCENVSEPFVCTFIVVDNTAPVLECPEGEDFGLVDEMPTVFADKATWEDNCQGVGETTDFSDAITSEYIVTEPTSIDGCEGPFSFQGFDSFGDGWNGNSINVLVNGNPVIIGYTIDDGFTGALVDLPASSGDIISTEINTDGAFDSEVSYDITDGSANVVATGGIPSFISDLTLCQEPGVAVVQTTLVRTFTADDGCGNTDECSVTYTWSQAPSCELAQPVACGDTVTGSTSGAPTNDLPFCGTSLSTASGVWYVLAGTGDVLDVSVDTFGSEFDTKLGVFSGGCDALVCVGGDDDDSDTLQSRVTFQSEIGVDYYIYVTGFGENSGDYTLTVGCELACLADAGTLTADAGPVDLAGNPSVEISATPDGNINIPDGFDSVFVLTTGSDLELIDANFNDAVFTVSAEGLYTIHTLVYDPNTLDPGSLPFDGSVTGFDVLDIIEENDLCASLDAAGAPIEVVNIVVPDNDLCADATPIACGDTVNGSTEFATNDDTLPNCDDDVSEGPGVWYVLTGTGDVLFATASTAGSNFDTKLAVYEGSCDDLICVGSDDDGGPGITSEVSFLSEPGVNYYIYVTGFVGFGNESGDYTLSVTCDQLNRQAQVSQEEDLKIDFRAYPVPFHNEVTISYAFNFETDVKIEFFDTKGLLVLSQSNDRYVVGSTGRTKFDLSRTSNQVFYVKLTTNNGTVTKKIVSSGKK